MERRAEFDLVADTVWKSPQDFSLQEFALAIVENNVTLMDPDPNAQPKEVINANTQPGQPQMLSKMPSYSKVFTAERLAQIKREGKLVLALKVKPYSLRAGKRVLYEQTWAGGCIMERGATRAIVHTLDTRVHGNREGRRAILSPSDVVFVNIREVK